MSSQPASGQEYAYPSPPRSDHTSLPPITEDLPTLPAFPLLQGAQAAPEPPTTQAEGQPQPTPEQLTPTIHFQIIEQQEEQTSNGAPPGAKPINTPQTATAAADTPLDQGAATAAIPISDDEGEKEPQDVDMEPAEQPPHNNSSNANKHTTTMKEACELQRRLRPHAEHPTHAPTEDQPGQERQHQSRYGPELTSGDTPGSADPIKTSTPAHQEGAPHTEENIDCQQQKSTPAQTKTQKYPATPQHLQTLYTSMCQKLYIPEQADNKQMQRTAVEAYHNIQRYADHALAVIRMLTLAKWNPKL